MDYDRLDEGESYTIGVYILQHPSVDIFDGNLSKHLHGNSLALGLSVYEQCGHMFQEVAV